MRDRWILPQLHRQLRSGERFELEALGEKMVYVVGARRYDVLEVLRAHDAAEAGVPGVEDDIDLTPPPAEVEKPEGETGSSPEPAPEPPRLKRGQVLRKMLAKKKSK